MRTYTSFQELDALGEGLAKKYTGSTHRWNSECFDIEGFITDYIDMLYELELDDRIFKMTKSNLTKNFYDLQDEAGLRRITIHGLSHSHVSLLISKKYDIFEVSKRIGHKSIKTTQDIYGHLFDDVQLTIANDLDNLRRG